MTRGYIFKYEFFIRYRAQEGGKIVQYSYIYVETWRTACQYVSKNVLISIVRTSIDLEVNTWLPVSFNYSDYFMGKLKTLKCAHYLPYSIIIPGVSVTSVWLNAQQDNKEKNKLLKIKLVPYRRNFSVCRGLYTGTKSCAPPPHDGFSPTTSQKLLLTNPFWALFYS